MFRERFLEPSSDANRHKAPPTHTNKHTTTCFEQSLKSSLFQKKPLQGYLDNECWLKPFKVQPQHLIKTCKALPCMCSILFVGLQEASRASITGSDQISTAMWKRHIVR